jgi:hypothetical protein
MITGVLAGLGGFLTVKTANLTNQANYNSTHAVLHQAKASDSWSEYQADSLKKHLDTDVAKLATDPTVKAQLEKEAADYAAKQAKPFATAQDELQQVKAELDKSDLKLQVKGLLDYAGMATQLGIALASVAALTRKKAAHDIGLFAGILAFLITGYALAYAFLPAILKAH